MRVLHVMNDLNLGGAQKLLEWMIPIMNQSGEIEAEILILTDQNNVFYESLIKSGIKVSIAKHKSIYDPRNIIEIKRFIQQSNFDIIHSHLFPAQYFVALSKLFLKNKTLRFITTEHNTYNRRRDWRFLRPIDRFIYAKYDLVVSISEKTKENLVKWIDPKLKKIDKHIVIENGVDLTLIERAKPYSKTDLIKNLDNDSKFVCMAGRFSEQKDQATLIKAISKLPENIHLLLLGEGELKRFNESLVRDLNIGHRVHFLGFRPDVPQILKTVDVVVLSSHWEGFGLAAVEGMAATKPVIASNVAGLFEVVFEYGLIFEVGNDNELASLITKLVEDEQFYEEIAKRCKKRSKDYSIQKTVAKLLNRYRKI